MKSKEIVFGKEAQDRIISGLDKTAKAVKSTLGPKGKNVLIQTPSGYQFTKDGITVAKNVQFSDNLENMGAQIAREAGNRSVRAGGDGPQPLYAKVATPNGWSIMGDLQVGDKICGTALSIQEVTGVFEKGDLEIYEIHFADKRVVECSEDHLWTVTTAYGKEKTLTVNQLKDLGLKRGQASKFFVKNSPIQYEKKEHVLNPYLIGVLLGDGSLTGNGSIEFTIGLAKRHVIDKIILPEGMSLATTEVPEKHAIRCKIKGLHEGKTIHQLIEDIGLLGKDSHTKFIPESYLFDDFSSREELLQGLLDTDGHLNHRNLYEFTTSSEALFSDVKTLMRGLGKQIWSGRIKRKGGYSDGISLRVFELKGNKYGTAITKIIRTGKKTQMRCIKVSNDDHLYFTDNCILTHNTTSTITLLNAIVQEGKRQVGLGTDPMSIRRGLDAASKKIVEWVKSKAVPVLNKDDLFRIATISANGDKEIAKNIADTLEKVGADGVVTLEEGKVSETKVNISKGFQFDRGMITEHFMLNPERQRTVFSEPIAEAELGKYDARFLPQEDASDGIAAYVWLINGRLNSLVNETFRQDFMDALNQIHSTNVPVIIIAEAIEGDALKLLATNAIQGNIKAVAVKAPGFGQDRRDILEDLARATGAKLRRTDVGEEMIKSFDITELGTVRFAEIGIEQTTLIPNDFQAEAIELRVAEIDAKLAVTTEEDYRHTLNRRKSMLSGGVASIVIGGRSDAEVRELRDLYEDALLAARAAAGSGIVPGGGTMLVKAAAELKDFSTGREAQDVGVHILRKALLVPFQEIIRNGGGELSSEVVLNKVQENADLSFGYDSNLEEYCDLLERGIIDPAKVVISEIEHAASMAGLLLSTDVVIGFEQDGDLLKALASTAGQSR